ncbi:uncharacterized protein LOC141645015 [Silene latifolia]|uniref:uncharacterized protein LOC141645015 n=1 Tax=Silene latifolia TaxID=37657 RepID=UPI003D789981
MGDYFQIRTLNLEHRCGVSNYNRKVISEYLAEKFLEFRRTNIDWKLKHFQDHVFKELNVHVSYAKCWLARSRAKLIIFGNGRDQYARVWDYASALIKFNNGSTTIVVCDGIESPHMTFRRMYICLQSLKVGFIRGCRPILGVDGVHLKGPYSRMCLVAVGKDGNNNIFPIAWAVMEAENTDSWTWFLELLINDLGKEEGNGLTFMPDRQKGLIEAINRVVPKANIRYCAQFNIEIEGLKMLSNEAHLYLSKISARHWSRHAFDTECKSNMPVNNICESFNAVLKEARDKPILTHMESMKRYVMKRNFEKREGVNKYDGRHMPYAKKYLSWAVDEQRFCTIYQAHADRFEVTYHGEGWV